MALRLPALTPVPLTRVRKPFDDPDWLFEIKHDGFRALAYVQGGEARLVSRNGHTFTRFAPLGRALARTLKADAAILDGELACLDGDGRSQFNALLFRRAEPCFAAFDLLWLDGVDLRDRPLVERKRALRGVIPKRSSTVLYLHHVRGRGVDLFRVACEHDLEGVVAKPLHSPYRLVGERPVWIKIKNRDYSQARDRHELFDEFRRRRA